MLRKVFDNMADGVLVADLKQRKFCSCNPTMCRITGYSRDELLCLGVADIHPRENLPYIIDQFRRQSKKEFTLTKDLPIKRKDGSVIFTDVNSVPMKFDGKNFLVGIFRDATERRNSEKELRAQRKALEEKNMALKEILAHVKSEKLEIEKKVTANANKLIMPILHKLRHNAGPENKRYLEMLESGIKNLTSQFGTSLENRATSLSSRETEICNLIRGGASTKEMAEMLHVSSRTIDTFRNRIRRKLGISSKNINLFDHLQKMS